MLLNIQNLFGNISKAVFSCKKDAKSICEKYCSTFRLYVVNIVLS